jgi:flagellum-specific peptidoglycan hydrolase FlgJ
MTRQEYINTYSPHVINAVLRTPLFASIMMAQAILESSDSHGVPGNSLLTRKAKNHFGIKADKSWKGPTFEVKTHEVINGETKEELARFRSYAEDADSFKDRVKFLQRNRRYQLYDVFSAHTPAEQARALQRSGYATDPDYAKKLLALIKTLNLESLDVLGKQSPDMIIVQ